MKFSTNFAAMLSLVGQIKSSLNCNPSLKLHDIIHAQYTYTQLFTGRISKRGMHSLQSYGCVRITSWITLVYVSMFQNTRYGVWNFHLFMFQFVSKRFETIESVDLDIFSLFQFVSVVLLYNLYVSMFRTTRCGVWNFHLFMFQFISKTFRNN